MTKSSVCGLIDSLSKSIKCQNECISYAYNECYSQVNYNIRYVDGEKKQTKNKNKISPET